MPIISDQNNSWIEVSLPVPENGEESISNFLFELGAEGCQNQENVLIAYFKFENWNNQKYQELKCYLLQLNELGFVFEQDQIRITEIENQDWNAEWKKQYKPFDIGNKIIIKPSWCDLDSETSKIIIEIDPQMAFGTGTHETTRLMIELLLEYIDSPETILDIGTGTGILAIAAARLSNAKIFAFDNDPVATSTAKQNIIDNHVDNRIKIFCSDNLDIQKRKFDLILANINRTVIVEMLPEISKILNSNGKAILSGILCEEKDKVINKLALHSLQLTHERKLGEWVGLVISPMK